MPITGVGFQNHVTADRYPSRGDLEDAFRRFGQAGLATEITEMDVASAAAGPLRDRLAAQTAAYAAAAEACAAVATCLRLSTWGVSDRVSWKPAEELPLLFDESFAPRPAYAAVAAALAMRPRAAVATGPRAPATRTPSGGSVTSARERLVVPGESLGLDAAEVADVGAAVVGGVGVEHLAPAPRARQADAVAARAGPA